MGKAYLAKGFTSLSKNPPNISGTEWVNKPDELTTKDSSKSSRSQYRNRGKRGRGTLIASTLINTNKDSVLMASIFVVLPHHGKAVEALIDTGSPSNYVSSTCAAWLQREGCQTHPVAQCVCSPLKIDACVCSEFQMHFVITISQTSKELIPLTAAIIPLSSYDLIIGNPIIIKHNLLKTLQLPLVDAVDFGHNNKQHANTLEHSFFGAILSYKNYDTHISHISDLLTGTTDDGDDLKELFISVPPWESSLNRDLPHDILIDKIFIQGDTKFKTQIRNTCSQYSSYFSESVNANPAKVAPLELDVNLAMWETPRNAGPPRVQSDVKQQEIQKQ